MSEQPGQPGQPVTARSAEVTEYDVHAATFADLDARTGYRLWQLRESVFVVEQTCAYQELDGRDLEPTTRHVWVTVRGDGGGDAVDGGAATPVAYLRLLEEPADAAQADAGTDAAPVAADGAPAEPSYRIGRVLVAPAHRGRGLAERLMRAALDIVGDRPSRLDAQSYLTGWYERFGYVSTGPEFLDDGIPHVPMARDLPAPEAREV